MKRIAVALVAMALLPGCSLISGATNEGNEGGEGGEQAGSEDPNAGMAASMAEQQTAPAEIKLYGTPAVGWTVISEMNSAGTKMVTGYTVVGEDGDNWHIEYDSPGLSAMAASFPELTEYVMGLTVQKSDGKVVAAVIGKAGTAGKEIAIAEPAAPYDAGAATGAETTSETITVAAGTFDCERATNNGVTSWSVGGDFPVLVKMEGANIEAYELSTAPEAVAVDAGGTSVDTMHWAYSNGTEYWVTQNVQVACFNPSAGQEGWASFGMKTAQMDNMVTTVGTAGEARLDWGGGGE